MPSIDDLNAALLKADANGDSANAHLFANQIQQMRQSGQANPPPAGPTSSSDVANAAGLKAGADEGDVTAAIGQVARQGTFGLQNYINAGARSIAQRLTGVKDPDSFADNLQYSRGVSQGEASAHPLASTIGGVLGTVLGGGAIAKGAKLAGDAVPAAGRLITSLAPAKNAPIANVLKATGTNAAIAGAQSESNGDDLPTVGRNAAISAVAGPIVGKGASMIASKIEPYAAAALGKLVPSFNPDKLSVPSLQAHAALAKNLDMSPTDLSAAYDSFQKLTGALPNTAQITDLASQGKLKALAAANGDIADAAMTAAAAGKAPLHVQLQQAQADRANLASMGMVGRPQTSQAILSARDQAMDSMMAAPSANGTALRDEVVSDPTGLLKDPHIDYALRPNTQVNNRLNQASPVLDRINTMHTPSGTNPVGGPGPVTIGDLDVIRKSLRDQQSAFMRPAPGANAARDPILAKEFGDMANKVEGLGTSPQTGHSDYGTALAGYRQVSRYNTGFEHGLAGNAIHDAPDDFTAADLKTPVGQAGYAHGNALARGQAALDAIAPNSVKSDTVPGVGAAASMAHAVTAPSPYSLASVVNHLSGMSLPKNVQGVVAKQLFSNDPVVVKQGIANLRRSGQSADDIRKLGAAVGGSAGASISSYLNGQ